MKNYLTEYKVILPGGMIKEGLQVSFGKNEESAAQKADDYLRLIHYKAEIHIGDTVEV